MRKKLLVQVWDTRVLAARACPRTRRGARDVTCRLARGRGGATRPPLHPRRQSLLQCGLLQRFCGCTLSLLFPHHQDLDEIFVSHGFRPLAQPRLLPFCKLQRFAEFFALAPQSFLLLPQCGNLLGQGVYFQDILHLLRSGGEFRRRSRSCCGACSPGAGGSAPHGLSCGSSGGLAGPRVSRWWPTGRRRSSC